MLIMSRMMDLEKIVNKDLISLDMAADSRGSAIIELTELLFKEARITSKEVFIKSVWERENVVSTFCGHEIALPHGSSASVKEPSLCFGRSSGFLWGDKDSGDIVRFVFLMAIPEVKNMTAVHSQHIDIMTAIAEMSLDENIRAVWASASSAEDILDIIRNTLAKVQRDQSTA